jgi:hypothetical protein
MHVALVSRHKPLSCSPVKGRRQALRTITLYQIAAASEKTEEDIAQL